MTIRLPQIATFVQILEGKASGSLSGIWHAAVEDATLKVGLGEDHKQNTVFKFPTTFGSSGQVLTINAQGSVEWGAAGGAGDVVGPGSANDEAIARFDGTTGKLLQNSSVYIGDTGLIGAGGITSASHPLHIQNDDDDTTIFLVGTGNNVQRIRMGEVGSFLGGVIAYDGSGNRLLLGTHATNDTIETTDTIALSILRGTARVGIGAEFTATSTLHVTGNLQVDSLDATRTNAIYVDNAGNVGLGTSSPTYQFDVSDAAGAEMRLYRNDASIVDGDIIGRIRFGGADATADGGRIWVASRGTWSGGSVAPSLMHFSVEDGGAGNLSNSFRMTLSDDGLVIGNSTGPEAPDAGNFDALTLHVHKGSAGTITANSNTVLTLENSTDAYLNFLVPGTGVNNQSGLLFGSAADQAEQAGVLYSHTDGYLQFRTGGNSTKMVIMDSGDVGIGNTDPDRRLVVQDTTAGILALRNTGGSSTGGGAFIDLVQDDGAAISSGHRIGGIAFRSTYDSTNEASAGAITCFADGTWTSTSYPTELRFETTAVGSTTRTTRMTINSDGEVGIGAAPTANIPLLVKALSTDPSGIRLVENDNTTYWDIFYNTTTDVLDFRYNGSPGTNGGFLSETLDVGQIDFTGQHRTAPSVSSSFAELSSSVGLIVVASGEYSYRSGSNEILVNEAIPTVELSSIAYDKRVFGVVSDSEESGSIERSYQYGAWGSVMSASIDDNRLMINSLGEGGIWVCNWSGSLENGDYIASSPIPGLGMLQDDDLLHNYTVAKITMDCDFDLSSSVYQCEEVDFSGTTYRKAFVGCTYHCG